jgi:hypothetical protein
MRSALLLAGVLSAAISAGAFAEGDTGSTQLEWSHPSANPIVTWTAPTTEKGKLSVQPYIFFTRSRGVFDKESHYKAYTDKDKKWQWQEQLFLSYGVTDDLEIDALGTYQQNIRQIGGASAESTGFSDTAIYASYCIVKEKGWIPCIAGWYQLKIPTGKYQKADRSRLGTDIMGATTDPGAYDNGYGFIVTKSLKPFILHADAIWAVPIVTKVDGAKVQYATYARYDVGAEYFFYKGFNLMFELSSLVQGDVKWDGASVPATDQNFLILSPGFGWSNEKVQTLFAWQRTVAGTNVDVNDSLVLTVAFTF